MAEEKKKIVTQRPKEEIKGPERRTVEVTLDMSEKEVIKLDNDGARLQFDFERFRDLEEEAVRGLSKQNRVNYFAAQEIAKTIARHKKEEEEGLRPKDRAPLRILGRRPKGALRLYDKEKGIHYCAKRMDEVSDALDDGYAIVHASEKVKSPGFSTVGGSRRITKAGVDEMILLKVPEERYQEHLKAVGEESRARRVREREGFKESATATEKDSRPFDNTREEPAG